jgi:hypothetical protein
MEKLRIYAASPESARAMLAALSPFGAELDGWREVVIPLGRRDRQIVAVLNALEQHVTERADGPALVEIGRQSYAMHPAPDIE